MSRKPSKGALAARTETVHEKVGVEGKCIMNPDAFHPCEGRAIDEAERLVRKRLCNMPGGLEVDRLERQDWRARDPERFPEGKRRRSTQVRRDERNALGHDQVGRPQPTFRCAREIEPAGFFMVPIGVIGNRVPRTRINEHDHA